MAMDCRSGSTPQLSRGREGRCEVRLGHNLTGSWSMGDDVVLLYKHRPLHHFRLAYAGNECGAAEMSRSADWRGWGPAGQSFGQSSTQQLPQRALPTPPAPPQPRPFFSPQHASKLRESGVKKVPTRRHGALRGAEQERSSDDDAMRGKAAQGRAAVPHGPAELAQKTSQTKAKTSKTSGTLGPAELAQKTSQTKSKTRDATGTADVRAPLASEEPDRVAESPPGSLGSADSWSGDEFWLFPSPPGDPLLWKQAILQATRELPERISSSVSGSPRRSGKSRKSWGSAEEPPAFPTRLGSMLRERPVPVPPALLRSLPSTLPAPPARPKDASAKLRVCVRVGAGGSGESSGSEAVVSLDAGKREVRLREPREAASTRRPPPPKIFAFDAAFSAEDGLAEVCASALSDVVATVASGAGDGCLLSLGQAGPSKTQSLLGSAAGLGLLPTAVSWLFRLVGEWKAREAERRYSVRVSAVEVAGHAEELRDLLRGPGDEGPPLRLAHDSAEGVRLEGAKELRAQTPDQAAAFLDQALAARSQQTLEEERNSHLFYTLHVYQHTLRAGGDAASSVQGGRCRLLLVDLGSGEKSSKAARSALTLPAIGNVLLTLLQGQKYLPFKDSALVSLLRQAMGSAACRAVSVVATLSPDPDRYFDSLNTAQIAGRLHRLRRQRKTKLGLSSGGSSAGESSADERRRWPKAHSDLDCPTSSSEQSQDTVIYLGDPRHRRLGPASAASVASRLSGRHSAGETTDGEGPARLSPATPTRQGPTTPTPRTNPLFKPPAQFPGLMAPRGGSTLRQLQKETWIDGPKAGDQHDYQELEAFREQWIDGPNALDYSAAVPSPPKVMFTPSPKSVRKEFDPACRGELLDPYKREMIQKWVFNQEEVKAPVPRSPAKQSPDGLLPRPCDSSSMDTASDRSRPLSDESPSPVVATRDSCLQVEEGQIDAELGVAGGLGWAGEGGPEAGRVLEDIAEESEDVSEAASVRSVASSANRDALFRNEALASQPALDPLTLGGLQMLGLSLPQSSDSAHSAHPLRALSKEADLQDRLDSFSCTSEQLECLSLPATDQLGSEELDGTDSDLEAAMAASVTSLRSTGALARLREIGTEARFSEPRSEDSRETGTQPSPSRQIKMCLQPVSMMPALSSFAPDYPWPSEDASEAERRPMARALEQEKPAPPKAAKASPRQPSRLEKPSPRPLSRELHSHSLRSQRSTSDPRPAPKLITLSQNSKVRSPSAESYRMAVSEAKEPKGTPAPQRSITKTPAAALPSKPGWGRSTLPLPAKTQSKTKPVIAAKASSASKTPSSVIPVKRALPEPPAAKAAKSSKSPLMSFLRSPSRVKKPSAPATSAVGTGTGGQGPAGPPRAGAGTPGNRASSGYDSGHDSGIGPGGASPEVRGGLLGSPYRKLTQPRVSQRSSSGHGSDNSSVQSGGETALTGLTAVPAAPAPVQLRSPPDSSRSVGKSAGSRLTAFLTWRKSQRDSGGHTSSSGYESAGYGSLQPQSPAVPRPRTASKDSSTIASPSSVKSPPSAKIGRKKYFGMASLSRSRSAPQSPAHGAVGSLGERSVGEAAEESRGLRRVQRQVATAASRQAVLKEELRLAKQRLGVPKDRWSYDLHVLDVMQVGEPGLLDALASETRVLEKRVNAARSHLLLTTSFDAKPKRRLAAPRESQLI